MGDTLTAGQKLSKGDSLTSSNGAYTLTLQEDGNLVLAARGDAVWATGTDGQGVVRAEVQTDGNFVLYSNQKPVWHTDTKGKKNVKLVLQDDRNLVLYAADGPAWSSRTDTDAPPPAAPRLDTTPVDDLLVDDAHADDGPLPPRSLRLHRARLRALWLAQGIAADCAK